MAVNDAGNLPLASTKQALIDRLGAGNPWNNEDTCALGNAMLLNVTNNTVEPAETTEYTSYPLKFPTLVRDYSHCGSPDYFPAGIPEDYEIDPAWEASVDPGNAEPGVCASDPNFPTLIPKGGATWDGEVGGGGAYYDYLASFTTTYTGGMYFLDVNGGLPVFPHLANPGIFSVNGTQIVQEQIGGADVEVTLKHSVDTEGPWVEWRAGWYRPTGTIYPGLEGADHEYALWPVPEDVVTTAHYRWYTSDYWVRVDQYGVESPSSWESYLAFKLYAIDHPTSTPSHMGTEFFRSQGST